MDIAALIEQLIPFLMELIGGIISMVTSMATENSGALKVGAAATLIGGAAMTGNLPPGAQNGVDAVKPPPVESAIGTPPPVVNAYEQQPRRTWLGDLATSPAPRATGFGWSGDPKDRSGTVVASYGTRGSTNVARMIRK